MALSSEQKERIQERIKKAEELIPEIEEDIQKALDAGLDVSDKKKKLAELKEKVQNLKLQYGSGSEE